MKRIGIIGTSMRAGAFARALASDFTATHGIVGLLDPDEGKARGFCAFNKVDAPLFHDFESFLEGCRPDLVLVATVDVFHAGYIVKLLDRKVGVISEKPLCINAEQARTILAAHRRNPEVFAVTSHNVRYSPVTRQIKRLLDEGAIGKVMRLSYAESLDRMHGTSYFRRWNSRRKNSNGLELHKSCHHFDLLNYLLKTQAAYVSAEGMLVAYGQKAPHKFEGTRCHECPHKDECPGYSDYNHTLFAGSYTPDMCIWSPEIDIEDNYSASIVFRNGVLATYSLCAHANYSGEHIVFEGETGRLEFRSRTFRENMDPRDVHDTMVTPVESLRLYRFGKTGAEEFPVRHENTSHGGADAALFHDLFAPEPPPTLPTLEDGIQAVLTGCAVVESIRTGRRIDVQGQLKEV